MISVPSINYKGEVGEKVKLPEGIFGIIASPKVVAQAVRVYLGNQREASAKTKTRGEVKKTTAKMYRQKGTGRARHGSYSAPIFVGGGIAHGPDGKQNYHRKMPATLKRLALFSALSSRVKDMMVINNGQKLAKTKEAVRILKKIRENNEKVLIVVGQGQTTVKKVVRNLVKVGVMSVNELNTYQVLAHKKLALTAEALEELVKRYVS